MKSARNVSANEIANVLRMWMAAKGTENIGELLFLEHWWNNTRKMPRAADMVKFNDIALSFVRLASSLNIRYARLYDAMVLVQPPHVHDTFSRARSHTNNILKML